MDYRDLPDWFNFKQAYAQAVEQAKPGAHFVEVGCYGGRSTVYLADLIIMSGKDITLTCVDHWLGSVEHKERPELASIYDIFLTSTERARARLGDQFRILKSDSAEAAKCFANNSLDFVWLDAGHDYVSVSRDIKAWLPKVKEGGILGGDDYPMAGVGEAVRELIHSHEQRPENGWAGWWSVKEAPTPEAEGSNPEPVEQSFSEPIKRKPGRPRKVQQTVVN